MAASGVTSDNNTNGYACMKVKKEAPFLNSYSFSAGFNVGFVWPGQQKEEISDRERWQHLADLADFALAMKVTLMNINYQSFNNFMLRIGQCTGTLLNVYSKHAYCKHAYFTQCDFFLKGWIKEPFWLELSGPVNLILTSGETLWMSPAAWSPQGWWETSR